MHTILGYIFLTITLCLNHIIATPIAITDAVKRDAAPEPLPEAPTEVETEVDLINVGSRYLACYAIYSSGKVKRDLGLSDSDIVKRCDKFKRSAEPRFIADPKDTDGGGGGFDGGLDGGVDGGDGGEEQWPGDVGGGFLQCYETYTTDKRDLGLEESEIVKRCGKAKRSADPLFKSDPLDVDGGGGGDGGLGGDGGTPVEEQWPGDVGGGFLQCYETYTTDKRDLGLDESEIVKRCSKMKRDAQPQEEVQAADGGAPKPKPKPIRYYNYDQYVPV